MFWAFIAGALVMLAVLAVIGWWASGPSGSTAARMQQIKTEEQMAIWHMQTASSRAREAMLRAVQERTGRGQ